ncbi:Glycosyl_transferases group 1 family protein [Hexamita inflata]|uniref:Glycosyl transferases group 1 family protein n=1 Tax=Hexamita inflata TaxID=28002 RepID=A0AA86RC38_9EUKA|nr:Glycosyl transferases group 1 family protein [Hexamita inflata]
MINMLHIILANQEIKQIFDNFERKNLSNYSIGFISKRLNDGGVERVTQLLAQQLHNRGMQLLLVTDTPQENEYPIPKNVVRVILPFEDDEPISKTRSWDQIQQVLAQQNVEIVNLHINFKVQLFICQEHWAFRNYLTIQTLKRNNIPVIAVDHNFFLYPLCNDERRLFDFAKVAYPMVDALLCLSRVDVQLWKKAGVKNALYMPNPLTFDLDKIQMSRLETKNIILVGRFNRRHKQQRLAVEMMKKVLEEEPNAVLQFIGGGFEDYKEECRQLARELGIQNSVQFVDFQADIEAYYRNASVMVMTSAIEGFPMVLVESKSYGVPTVAFELDFCELWQEGITAVPKGDTDAMAREVVRLLQNQTFRLEKGMEARKAVEKFRTEETINKWVRLITGIIDGNGVVKQMQAEEEKVTEERAMEIYQKELEFWGQEDLRPFD